MTGWKTNEMNGPCKYMGAKNWEGQEEINWDDCPCLSMEAVVHLDTERFGKNWVACLAL